MEGRRKGGKEEGPSASWSMDYQWKHTFQTYIYPTWTCPVPSDTVVSKRDAVAAFLHLVPRTEAGICTHINKITTLVSARRKITECRRKLNYLEGSEMAETQGKLFNPSIHPQWLLLNGAENPCHTMTLKNTEFVAGGLCVFVTLRKVTWPPKPQFPHLQTGKHTKFLCRHAVSHAVTDIHVENTLNIYLERKTPHPL